MPKGGCRSAFGDLRGKPFWRVPVMTGEELFQRRRKNFQRYGELSAFNLALVAEALDTIQRLREENVGGETVERRLGEFKQWDPDIYRVDKDTEEGYRTRLARWGRPVVLLSEEAGRVEVGEGTGGPVYVIADPFDGSFLFKHGIPDFWYSSLAFYNADFQPLSCVVGDAVPRRLAFANETGAYIGDLVGDRLLHCVRLDASYRTLMGRPHATDTKGGSIESYAMKPTKFLFPLVDRFREFLRPFKFFLPNGGPYGFVDVAEGKVDVYFAPGQPYVDIFSGLYIAQQAEAVVTDFEGNPVRPTDDVETVHDVVATTNPALHEVVLKRIAECLATENRPEGGRKRPGGAVE